ncbi:MAG TPA: lipid-binding SYLF domain-containing protein [Stellaceae bacterium]|nr:lipid-binding SYLF domain-containing protein [Stellaceae bacterium]
MKRILTLLAAALLLASTQVARASDQQEVVDGATIVADKIQSQSGAATNIRELLHRARALLVVPSLLKGGFFLGGQGGTGVLLVRDPKTNTWSSPAFYGLAGGSFGLQIGVEVSEVALIIMTDKALEAVLQNEFKVGAEAGLTLATVGAGAEASTTSNVGADIYSFSESKGLFGGVALQGAALNPKPDWDKIYYGRPVTTREIVLERKAATSGATRLRTTLDSISQH